MARESTHEKARRYLGEGRLVVERAGDGIVRARCRGGGAEYELGFAAGEWWCSCPARGRCAHLLALQLVTVAPAPDPDPDPEPALNKPVRAGFE
jgi:hypothetical protein